MAGPGLTSLQTNVMYRLLLSAGVLLLAGIPTSVESQINAASFLLLTPPSARGNLTSNNVLRTAERIHSEQVNVPHSYVTLGDDVYAATAGGLVVNVAPCRPVVIANLRPRGCRTLQRCGHLISIRLNRDNLLVVLDAYRGVFEVHPVTGVTRQIYDTRTPVNGRVSIYLNDLVLMKDGTIIMSDPSPRFSYDREFWIRFEGNPDGRLIGFNPASGQVKEVLSGLAYPTGLEITANGQALLVSEATRARVMRLDLSKGKFFQRSYVNINLPGMPEHIRKSGRDTYWVGLSYPRFRGEPSFLDQYSRKPDARKFLAMRRTMEELQLLSKRWGLAVELDETGKIRRSIHDPSGLRVSEVLEVTEYIGVFYVGTRAQHAAVRVVGAPSELNVDSLVQVLRGRCKVLEDQVEATKESLRQQLKGSQRKVSQKSTKEAPGSTTPLPQRFDSSTASSKPERPKHRTDFKSLSKKLFLLHRTLLNATVHSKKLPQSVPHSTQAVPLSVTNKQQGQISGQPNVHTTRHQTTVSPNNSQVNGQNSTTPSIPSENLFLPQQGPKDYMPVQNTDGISNVKSSQNNSGSTSSPTQSHVLHSIQEGHTISYVVPDKTTQESVLGQHNFYIPREHNYQTQSPQTYEGATNLPTVQQMHAFQQQTEPPLFAVETTTAKKNKDNMNDLGGFMGFLGSSAFLNGALVTSGDQIGLQDPQAAYSLPDPGQIDPGLNTHQGLSTYKDQFLPGMDSSLNFEQFPVPLDQAPGNDKQTSGNETQTSPTHGSQPQHTQSGVQKRPDISVQDISIKDANAIQNMQMFHPTDRPEQLVQGQNQGGMNTMSPFSQDVPILNEQQQLKKDSYSNQPSEAYGSAQGDQIPPQQMDTKHYTNSYQQRSINSPAAGPTMSDQPQASQMSQNVQSGGFDPGSPTHQSFTMDSIYDRTPNLYPMAGNNSTDISSPFLMSGAARIRRNQPGNNIHEKSFLNNINTEDIRSHGYIIADPSFKVQKNHSELSMSAQSFRSFQNTGYINQSSIPRPHYKFGHNFISDAQFAMPFQDHAGAFSGYIRLQKGPGQYILIPLRQRTLPLGLNRASRPQKSAQKIASHVSHQNTDTIKN